MILAAPAKITAKKDVNIVLKKGAEKSSITCTKNAQAQVDNQTKKAISVKIADGTTLKVESGESCTITPKGKKEDTSGEDKTDEKDKTDGKDQKTDDTSDGNASSGSSSVISVSIIPGAMQLTVILRFATSWLKAFAAPIRPAFEAL